MCTLFYIICYVMCVIDIADIKSPYNTSSKKKWGVGLITILEKFIV